MFSSNNGYSLADIAAVTDGNRGGFFGTHHFSRANDYLRQHGLTPIEW